MTQEQMKELYATGDWVCVRKAGIGNTWQIHDSSVFEISEPRVLIHKKHSGVLDHVLSGGKVRCIQEFEVPPTIYEYNLNRFVELYNVDFFYEIIKDKPDLNGHYCLATKELECTKCKLTKSNENFSKSKQKSNGYSSWCKRCTNENAKAYNRTKVGHISQLYNSQVHRSKKKGFDTPRYSRKELEEFLLDKPEFHALYDAWEKSGFCQNLAPSVDRIDDYVGYRFDNIQLMTWHENSKKGADDRVAGTNNKTNFAVVQFDKNWNFMGRFHSASEAARQTKGDKTNILRACKGNQAMYRNHIWRFEDEVSE